MPDRVKNLRNVSHPSVILLTWDMAEPNGSSYCVTVQVNDTNRHDLIQYVTCGLQEANFSFSRVTHGYVYLEETWCIFTVTAVNSVGRGPPSNPLMTNFLSGEVGIAECQVGFKSLVFIIPFIYFPCFNFFILLSFLSHFLLSIFMFTNSFTLGTNVFSSKMSGKNSISSLVSIGV